LRHDDSGTQTFWRPKEVIQQTAQKAQHIYERKTDGRAMDEDMSKYEPPWWKCQWLKLKSKFKLMRSSHDNSCITVET
jgi:hypothetical protein